MKRPLRYSWVLPDVLAVGERPARLADLAALGFGAVLSLQEDDEPRPEGEAPAGLKVGRVRIRDGIVGGVPTVGQLAEAVAFLDRFIGEGLRTYVHCYAGVGRSPTVCMAYLARRESLGLGDAYWRV